MVHLSNTLLEIDADLNNINEKINTENDLQKLKDLMDFKNILLEEKKDIIELINKYSNKTKNINSNIINNNNIKLNKPKVKKRKESSFEEDKENSNIKEVNNKRKEIQNNNILINEYQEKNLQKFEDSPNNNKKSDNNFEESSYSEEEEYETSENLIKVTKKNLKKIQIIRTIKI